MNVLLCLDSEATLLGIFDPSLAPSLLYYAYIPISLSALLLGVLVYRNRGGFSLPHKILLILTVLFSLYLLNDIVQWITVPAGLVHFSWQIIALFFTFLSALLLYFVYSFVYQRDFSFLQKTLLLTTILPVVVLLPTSLNMAEFDLVWCEAHTGPLYYYVYAFMGLIAFTILLITIRGFLTHRGIDKVILGLGSIAMIGILTLADLISEYIGNFEINLVGPVGMLIFLILLAYLIVKFHAFNIKLLGAQALVIALWFLIGSLLFVAISIQTKVIAGITLVLAIIGGYFLVRSVKKEVEQREEIAKLAESLAKANERLKVLDKLKSEFVSIASHQLRSPLTAIRGYASMLVEGSYGKLPEKAQEAAVNIADSAKYMALSVEDYLNVSRIEAGNMKYELSDFNLKDTAEKIVDELRPVAMKKGLVMVFRSDCTGSCSVHADIGKTRQIIMNLLDNSMKYTPKGTVTVVAHDDVKKKKMYITIEDTGIGMSKETLEEVFDKFVRAKNANNVNTTGTGLGLFVAKKMVTDMGGRVWAESDGEGKGSRFHIELPMLPGKSMR